MRPTFPFWLCLCYAFSAEVFAQSPNASPVALDRVQRDLALLREEKLSRTPAQAKISSLYVTHLRKERGEPKARALPQFAKGFGPKFLRDDVVGVDVRGEINNELVALIKKNRGVVLATAPDHQIMAVEIPIGALEVIASLEQVISIMPMAEAAPQKGSTSEGDIAHATPAARDFYGATGSGVKVGVISDSVDYLAEAQATGDLPAVTVLSDVSGIGEGTAMLEIVHDLAPNAELMFATGFSGGVAGMVNAIESLGQAGADIIVDDLFFFNQSPFQDDIIARAAEDAISSGVVYFTSAGNYGNRNDATAGVYEGDYNSSGDLWQTPNELYQSVHEYPDGYAGNLVQNSGRAFLFWSDPLGGSSNDYDLLFYDSDGIFVTASTNIQNGSQDPIEDSIVDVPAGYYIVIAKYSGDDRFMHLSMVGSQQPQLSWATGGFVRGQGGAEGVITVAATPARFRTEYFDGTEAVETYSSDGYRRVFYDRNGSPYTPGNFLSTGGKVRVKPNVTAADCVKTQPPGFDPFCGTSAAAPHAAAIGALMLSARPGLTLQQMIAGMVSGALDIESPGFDRDSGVGIIMANLVLDSITSVPAEPVLLSAVAASGQVELEFDPPVDNGGIPISSYAGKCGSVSAQGGGSPLLISGLTNGQSYSCSVAAANAKGPGAYSNVVNVVVSVPATPEISHFDYGDGEIYLTVAVVSNGSPDITSYHASCTDGVNTSEASSTFNTLTVGGLINGVAYRCTVSATNSVGTSATSPLSPPITPEVVPSGLPLWLLYEASKS